MNYNTRSPITGFITWAERRIAEEVERNEQLAKDAGTAVCFVEHKRLPYNTSNSQKLNYIKQVDALRRQGIGSLKACKKVGMHPSTYSQWRNKLGLGRFVL